MIFFPVFKFERAAGNREEPVVTSDKASTNTAGKFIS